MMAEVESYFFWLKNNEMSEINSCFFFNYICYNSRYLKISNFLCLKKFKIIKLAHLKLLTSRVFKIIQNIKYLCNIYFPASKYTDAFSAQTLLLDIPLHLLLSSLKFSCLPFQFILFLPQFFGSMRVIRGWGSIRRRRTNYCLVDCLLHSLVRKINKNASSKIIC